MTQLCILYIALGQLYSAGENNAQKSWQGIMCFIYVWQFLWEKLRCSWNSAYITANFGMDAEIEATQPWRAALLRLRPVKKLKAECLVHLSFVHSGTAGYNITAHALTT